MIQLETQIDSVETQRVLSRFVSLLPRTSSRALILDYDGTLAKFRLDPEKATPYSGIPSLLERIRSRTGTRIAIVTGRRAHDVLHLLGLKNIEVWGCHGLERLCADGTHFLPEVDDRTLQAIADADDLLSGEGIAGLAELKPVGIAVHWRGQEEFAEEIGEKVKRVWAMMPIREGLRLESFDGGMEIRVGAQNKGDVVRAVFSEMADDAAVAYLGDDATDEDAFAALRGRGLGILVRDEPRPTAAEAWVRPPDGVISFLKDWISACAGAYE